MRADKLCTLNEQLDPILVRQEGLPADLLNEIRADFPMLNPEISGHRMIYFNNAATALKPQTVLDAMNGYYQQYGVNVFRGVDQLGYRATKAYEETHTHVEDWLQAVPGSVVLTRGTTDALNLVCLALEKQAERFRLTRGHKLIVSQAEHHANFLPWQQLALRHGMEFCLVDMDPNGVVRPEALAKVLDERTALVALNQVSNVLGGRNDIATLARLSHEAGALFVCDGAQAVVQAPVDVQALDVDFFAFSGHKIYGPTGIGCLYGRPDLLNSLDPVQYGGEMIDQVGLYESSFASCPARFEAGTPMIAEAIGLDAALAYIRSFRAEILAAHKAFLGERLLRGLQENAKIEIYNSANFASGILSFNVKGAHAHDVASVFDRAGISLRAGQHCAQPMMTWLGQQATLRASLSFYNTAAEVDRFLEVAEGADAFLSVFF